MKGCGGTRGKRAEGVGEEAKLWIVELKTREHREER